MASMASRTRAFPLSRIVALVLIGVVTVGLVYLRINAGDDRVSVPAGAKAGDLKLERCNYSTEKGAYAADCGTLVVPENRSDPRSKLIALPVTRVRARSANPAEPIIRLEGGPGHSNMDVPTVSRFADKHDVVMVGYRGVDGSVRLDCPEVESALKRSTDLLGDASFHAYGDAFRACANRLRRDGIEPASYGFVQQVDDMEAARKALGYGRVDLFSESAGTRTALIYAWRYPQSIHRSVMVGVNPPGDFLWDPQTTDELLARYADLCAKDAACSKRTKDLAATLRTTAMPGHYAFLRIKPGNVRVVSFFGLMESTTDAGPLSGPMILESWMSAAEGDASGLWFGSLLGDFVTPKLFVWGQFAAAGTLDHRAVREYFSSGRPKGDMNIGYAATSFLWGGGRLAEAWPAAPDEAEYATVRTSNVETLLIGGDLDFSTPPQMATRQLLPFLPNGHQVVIPGFGHTSTFFTEQRDAGTHLVNTFYDSGRVDSSLYKPQPVDFAPKGTHTGLGKGFVWVMVGVGLVTLLSVAWLMPRRVRKRGRFGPKAAATLRSIYPVILGLGGWFVGVLIVQSMLGGVSLDNQALAFLAVGMPVGLGVYWAWVHHDWAAETKKVGLVAAMGGAVLGAWLGFHASSDIVALATAIFGAIAGANLALIVFDIRRVRSGPGAPGRAIDLSEPARNREERLEDAGLEL